MAIAAVLVEHKRDATGIGDADALADAVSRLGGSELVNEFVDASRIADLAPRLVAAASA